MVEKIAIRPATIIIENGKVLLVKSKYEEEFYLFPGGGIEKGETIEEATIRETLEETGFEVELIKPVYINEYINTKDRSKRVVNIFFLAKLKNLNQKNKRDNGGKIEKVEWVPLEKLKKTDLKPKLIRERLKEDLENNFTSSIIYSVDYKK